MVSQFCCCSLNFVSGLPSKSRCRIFLNTDNQVWGPKGLPGSPWAPQSKWYHISFCCVLVPCPLRRPSVLYLPSVCCLCSIAVPCTSWACPEARNPGRKEAFGMRSPSPQAQLNVHSIHMYQRRKCRATLGFPIRASVLSGVLFCCIELFPSIQNMFLGFI